MMVLEIECYDGPFAKRKVKVEFEVNVPGRSIYPVSHAFLINSIPYLIGVGDRDTDNERLVLFHDVHPVRDPGYRKAVFA